MKGQLLNGIRVYLPLQFSALLSRFSLPVLFYLRHPFTGPVPAPSLSLSLTPSTFGVGNCQARHESDTDTDMLAETAAEQLAEQHTPAQYVISSVLIVQLVKLVRQEDFFYLGSGFFLFPHSILAGMC